jgi:hypothetical protein
MEKRMFKNNVILTIVQSIKVYIQLIVAHLPVEMDISQGILLGEISIIVLQKGLITPDDFPSQRTSFPYLKKMSISLS